MSLKSIIVSICLASAANAQEADQRNYDAQDTSFQVRHPHEYSSYDANFHNLYVQRRDEAIFARQDLIEETLDLVTRGGGLSKEDTEEYYNANPYYGWFCKDCGKEFRYKKLAGGVSRCSKGKRKGEPHKLGERYRMTPTGPKRRTVECFPEG